MFCQTCEHLIDPRDAHETGCTCYARLDALPDAALATEFPSLPEHLRAYTAPRVFDGIGITGLLEKARQCTAYLESLAASPPGTPAHRNNAQRAWDRARDVQRDLYAYLETIDE